MLPELGIFTSHQRMETYTRGSNLWVFVLHSLESRMCGFKPFIFCWVLSDLYNLMIRSCSIPLCSNTLCCCLMITMLVLCLNTFAVCWSSCLCAVCLHLKWNFECRTCLQFCPASTTRPNNSVASMPEWWAQACAHHFSSPCALNFCDEKCCAQGAF
jgi:hypothetical protein